MEQKPSPLYQVSRKSLYQNEVKQNVLSLSHGNGGLTTRENPFVIMTFPGMMDIKFDEETGIGQLMHRNGKGGEDAGAPALYEEQIERYRSERYRRYGGENEDPINNVYESVTMPRLYNVVTGDGIKNSLDARLNKDTDLIIKVVDLGDIWYRYRKNIREGNIELRQIYNEIRVGFFLNELRYAYEKILTNHFMIIVDWFVSDVNLYPSINGNGPYQYIVSEKLDTSLYVYLSEEHTDMMTLKCTLFCIAHALEMAWATHRYIHFDLHAQNIMLKKVNDLDSPFRDKDYHYTRAYSEKMYRLPQSGLHNTIVKVLDYGSNYMMIPGIPEGKDKTDLFAHIKRRPTDGSEIHLHEMTLARRDVKYGVGLSENRTCDMRRILWDLMTKWPVSYWRKLKEDSVVDFTLLSQQMTLLIDLNHILVLGKEMGLGTRELFRADKPGQVTVEDILLSPVRGFYIDFYFGFDAFYMEMQSTGDSDDESLRQYRQTQARDRYGIVDFDAFELKMQAFERWHETIMRNHIWTDWSNAGRNATSFLSSRFFDSLVSVTLDETRGVWVGERSSSHVIGENATY